MKDLSKKVAGTCRSSSEKQGPGRSLHPTEANRPTCLCVASGSLRFRACAPATACTSSSMDRTARPTTTTWLMISSLSGSTQQSRAYVAIMTQAT
eukprot:683142-Rhodomonas_salina.4